MHTIHQTIAHLHNSLSDYIEATYHISAPSLIAQRRGLLGRPGVIHQVPYLESTPRYRTGVRFAEMEALPAPALEVYSRLSAPKEALPRLIYDPPYLHQSEAIRESLINGNNLVVMTGTGSGKTEAFLLPILGKLAREASTKPGEFGKHPAMRALVLYPMNALVNDQLGRLRALFGDPRVLELFRTWSGRPPRFARYTSRTPYAGVRTSKKDSVKLKSFNDFYLEVLRSTKSNDTDKRIAAERLLGALKDRGKWPAKPDLETWFGEKGGRWQDRRTGDFVRAITMADDSELLTRHEVQATPPDLLITNYSMLEYMLMRPIERPIFDRTREWLASDTDESFLIVLDEAHLYRGAAGAEVGLLLRRLRDRLDVDSSRFQVICATASFDNAQYACKFGAQLSGLSPSSFYPIVGTLDERPNAKAGSASDVEVLARLDLEAFYHAQSEPGRREAVRPLLEYRGVSGDASLEVTLYHALKDFRPMCMLINETMKEAHPVADLGSILFPDCDPRASDAAVTALMALGSMARPELNVPGLLPCRIHNFFRGLSGLWVCMDPDCSELTDAERGEKICGKMYSQPRERCRCEARVLELYTCRNCGTAYARAYTDDVDSPSALWSEPGARLRIAGGETAPLLALDLLLEEPRKEGTAEPADYDLETGRINPGSSGPRTRTVFIRHSRLSAAVAEEDGDPSALSARGQFTPCAVCGQTGSFGRSYVQDHQTKGDQPFQAIVARQIQIQPPGPVPPTAFAPLQGRKVLAFSDSRQVAARLAPNLQMYSVRDSLRPLIAWGYRRLQSVDALRPSLSLDDLYLAVLLASKTLGVRLRPEMKPGESFGAERAVAEAVAEGLSDSDSGLAILCMETRTERPPEALLENIVTTVQDRFLGFEALAIASLVERSKHTPGLENLPDIPSVADSAAAKVGLARTWLRCWQSHGFWLNAMPTAWWRRPRTQGTSIRGQKGKFRAMETVLPNKTALKTFWDEWAPKLNAIFTEEFEGGLKRLRGSELSLDFADEWVHCRQCKSVHRPVSGLSHCLDCGGLDVVVLSPDTDPVFVARKGFYRKPVVEALGVPPRQPMALIAAEHTAQLNSPQNEDVFSKAEENELLFQDIALPGAQSGRATAIDVLSSTTTMEVGIDIGTLSGVALRNMPPARANYQQRAGRAGRRGNAVATVVAFGSADSHDEHYFSHPDNMIRGQVVDPRLTLDNQEIVKRHVRAFLLQSYHQSRIPTIDPSQRHDLFSVLGTVAEFRMGQSILNRDDFAAWLAENEATLRQRVAAWIPTELAEEDSLEVLDEMRQDCLSAIDDAIRPWPGDTDPDDDGEQTETEDPFEAGEEKPQQASNPGKLLDRLLYCGKLPRYAFPTDVATFHVFDRDRSTRFRPIMRFAPSQGLPIALTQYAPGKQVWISGKCYTSGAIYSIVSDDRHEAWRSKRIYMECADCGFARTFNIGEADRGETRDCEACGSEASFGPARYWLRPPGFAHPIDLDEVTSPDDVPETSYATRAKLTMGTPTEDAGWVEANSCIRALRSRQHLLVSNTGPSRKGYTYCVKCGRIEASNVANATLVGPHRKPYPESDDRQVCDGVDPTRHIVLGTDFITDIALFSMRVGSPLNLRPGQYPTAVALRTVSEGLARAACNLLEIEPGELMAEYRPALTRAGAQGLEAEIFLYDTLPGGAGFASQLAPRGLELYERALEIMKACPENCDASCYRCLRSFKNKIEHALLDRHVGKELLESLVTGVYAGFDENRSNASTDLLYNDLLRNSDGDMTFERNARVVVGKTRVNAPILATDRANGRFVIALAGPLTGDQPPSVGLRALQELGDGPTVIVENELLVRGSLPTATRIVYQKIRL